MPPYASSNGGFSFSEPKTVSAAVDSNVVTIDVGGQLFQTTKQTLTLAGSSSIFSGVLSVRGNDKSMIPFIDRDPEIFSVLLSLLRTGNLPSKSKNFDLQDLVNEAKFYGIETLVVNSSSNPSQFDAFNLEKSTILQLNGRDSPSAISTTENGFLHVAHGSKITYFDWSLRRKSTILTQFNAVDSLLALSPTVCAAGATDFSGLQVLDLQTGVLKQSLNWDNITKSSSTVQAIGSSPQFLFTSFESGRRNSNSIMVYDLQTLTPVSEIGHYEIYGADLDSAIPSTKLNWISRYNLLMASGSHSGPSGITGNIKLWDIRSGNIAFELKEKTDCFADVTFSDNFSAIFKVGVNTGEVFYNDIRCLDSKKNNDSSWTCLGQERKVINGKKEGVGSKIESHGNQVFHSKNGDLELWSEVLMGSNLRRRSGGEEGLLEDRVFRRNLMGRVKDYGGSQVTNMAFGGNKIFVTRKDQQFVEVWQSSVRDF